MKFKSYLLIFIASILIFTSSLFATAITNPTYKQTVTNYIEQLSQLQNQVFTLARKATFGSPESKSTFNSELDFINNSLKKTMDSMNSYYQTLPPKSTEKRNMLILVNASTLIESSLFQLNAINNTDSDVEKMVLLEDYFRFKVEATDTLNLVQHLLSEY